MPNKQFQYISCCSLSFYSSINKKSGEQVSIHLMLQFIQHSDAQRNSKLSFQYISCCSLSNYRMLVQKKNFSFNTSHVVVYRRKSRKRRKTAISFNTSHVVVYPQKNFLPHQFYYRFNTSHVVVYLDSLSRRCGISMFQYISCCSLSVLHTRWRTILSWFQYISCCSLSKRERRYNQSLKVSIHLMLQFIGLIPLCNHFFSLVSIHLMLQFIQYVVFKYQVACFVSIHLMLQFI